MDRSRAVHGSSSYPDCAHGVTSTTHDVTLARLSPRNYLHPETRREMVYNIIIPIATLLLTLLVLPESLGELVS